METITLTVGSVVALNSGQVQDSRREVQFEGELLAEMRHFGHDRNGNLTDTRGVDHALYRTEEGRLIVHEKEWSNWRGEPTTEQMVEVEEDDLQPGGVFELLGAKAGFGRPLTLDEALEVSP